MNNKIHFENLDGLRFFCFLMVFLFHSFHTEFEVIKTDWWYEFIAFDLFGNGNIGVNFFFVLSGFLITYLLLEEKKRFGGIHIGKFYVRRILRIWPLYYFCVLFGFFIFPLLKSFLGQIPDEQANIWYYISFLSNFDFLRIRPDASILGVLWSVAVEEQFYFFWPILLTLVSERRLIILLIILVIFSIVFRAYYDSYLIHEHHTFSVFGDMSIGGIGAWCIRNSDLKSKIHNLRKWEITLIYIFFMSLFFFRDELYHSGYSMRVMDRIFVAIICLLIILEQSFSKNSIFKIGKIKSFTYLGKISYGLYCLHFIGILITTNTTKLLGYNTKLWQVLIVDTLVSLLITILISHLSFKYFESYFLKWKNRFALITKG